MNNQTMTINGQETNAKEVAPKFKSAISERDWDASKRYWKVENSRDLLVCDASDQYTMNTRKVEVTW